VPLAENWLFRASRSQVAQSGISRVLTGAPLPQVNLVLT